MMTHLETIFGELGIIQYLDAFVDQGFDSWDTILDITESDLDALGVKLGHRRKLQRRIANTRGVAPDASLVSPTQPALEELRLVETQRTDVPRPDIREASSSVVTKRKYRRHPKPDDNAPERPPSAYVLFSNKMREELKGRNLTFTEIAKLVGENWQSLSQAEKEPYESQAQAVKDKYHSDLAEYKKTAEYKKYMAYLQEFKTKHALPSADKDSSKRIKLSDSGGPRTSAIATPSGTSRSGSRSDSPRGSEPPPNRQQRVGSTVSVADSQFSGVVSPVSYHATLDESVNSPLTTNGLDRRSSERSPIFNGTPRDFPSVPSHRNPNWSEDERPEQPVVERHLPSLSDVFDGRRLLNSDNTGYFFPRETASNSPPVGSGSSDNRPTLRKEQSSAGSTSSSSSFSYPRTPIEGSLPIHALLAAKSSHAYEPQQPPVFHNPSLHGDYNPPFAHPAANGVGGPLTNVTHAPVNTRSANPAYGGQSTPVPGNLTERGKRDSGLDGMSALLQAGEIVDRRAQ
ncbi:hypothetical protein B0H63DRAFT_6575 [Podospora didyma]|uniref:HMG box domain-containing protein n=1 Tax=Podospora didyma TaxID=330526 RepID=A0AAE0P481_9PEZI|nr:hypothetical protein B0H63DRAFT_6575 [Podospora didyma]